MKTEVLQTIAAIQNTLDHITVCGHESVNNMRNVMVAVENLRVKLSVANFDETPGK